MIGKQSSQLKVVCQKDYRSHFSESNESWLLFCYGIVTFCRLFFVARIFHTGVNGWNVHGPDLRVLATGKGNDPTVGMHMPGRDLDNGSTSDTRLDT